MSETLTMKREGFSIFAKLLSGFILVIVITGTGDFYSYTQMNRISNLTTQIYNHPLRVTRAVLSADINIIKIHRSMKDVALSSTPTEIETVNGFVNDYEIEVYKHFETVEKWILGGEGATLLTATIKLFRDWKPIRDEVISLTKAGNRTLAFDITKGKGAKHVEVLNNKIEELKDYAANKASGMLSDSIKTKEKIIKTTSIIYLVLVLISGLFGYFLSRTITDSIKQLIKGVIEFSRGTLNYKVKVKFKDEISWLANAFNDMATERRKIEEALLKSHTELEKKVEERTADYKRAKDEAERANKLKSEFLANISHELRTPMHHVLGCSDQGIEKINRVSRDKLLLYFSQIKTSGERLMLHLNDLLDLAKLESGRTNYQMKKNNLGSMVDSLIHEFSHSEKEKSIHFDINKNETSTLIECDELKINQVLRNLLSNAVKFSSTEKSISISFDSNKMHAENNILSKKLIPTLIVRIKDEAIGIPEDELSTVFNKFVQSSRTKTGAGGTGLGLAICKEIIEAHNGNIWAGNNPEGGATFSFMLPYEQEAK
jgi:signal transduction histidine kinase